MPVMPTPRPSSSLVIPAAVLLTGFALGWFGRNMGSSAPPATAVDPAPRKAAVATHDAAPPPALPPSEAARQFEAVRTEQTTDYQRRLRLAQAVEGLDRAGVVAALENERAHIPVSGTARTLPTEALLARFAELDPPGAVFWLVQAYPVDDIESEWLDVTLDTWVARDANAALAWGRSLPAGSLRENVNSELLEQMVALDPAGTAQRIATLGDKDLTSVSTLFTRLAERDLTAACAQAAQLPARQMSGAVEGIIQAWAQHQPADAYAWIAQIAPGAVRDAATEQLYNTWGEQDPAAAAAFLLAHGGPDTGKYVDNLAETWAKRDLATARAWSEHLPPQLRSKAMSQVVSAWTESDPRGATEYAMTLPGKQRASEVSTTVGQWAKQDMAAASAWMQKQPAGSVRRSALQAVCGVWADQDPRACLDWLSGQTGDDSVKQQRTQTLATWAASAPEEVWQWSQALPDVKRRGEAEAAALTALAENDPAQAGARLAQLPKDDQADAATEVGSKWVETDPAAASRWAGGLAEGDARTNAMRSVASSWAEYDAKSAAAWLTGQPTGEAKDAGIEAVVTAGPDDMEPTALMKLAQTIHDPDTRTSALAVAASNWLSEDRPKAQAWITNSRAFTEEQRTRLLSREDADEDDAEPGHTVVIP